MGLSVFNKVTMVKKIIKHELIQKSIFLILLMIVYFIISEIFESLYPNKSCSAACLVGVADLFKQFHQPA
ncbi:MAG: hypothetical protein JWR61_199 [Ferruginibacter sp.]|nr:hypothetical protein [Ferruginibacter sp.]